MNAWLYLETPVFTAAIMAAFGWWIRVQHAANVERDRTLNTQSQALAVLVESIRPIREWQRGADERFRDQDRRIEKHDTRMGTLSETTSVLAATLENHLNWHERETRHRVPHLIPSIVTGTDNPV